jgi:5-methylcytosine-specific restriction protein A
MPIPNADVSAIRAALHEFDRSLRASDELAGWEQNGAQLYAIEYEGRHYPPKKIISLATQFPVGKFTGGRVANGYLEARGFKIVRIKRGHANAATVLVSFERGRRYKRQADIHEPFGGSRQSGIAPSTQAPAIFIFTGESGEQFGYEDSFDNNGVFSYTGEGQVGDMKFTRGNLAIREHAKTGRSIHLFRALRKGSEHEYLGEFAYASHVFRTGRDKDGNERRVIVFNLVPVGLVADLEREPSLEEDEGDAGEVLSVEEARKRALAAASGEEERPGSSALRTLYRRSRAVSRYVLLRASGKCESCGSVAPFKRRNGKPYLEPHHTNRLSDGGLDHPRFVAALCPTCHREIHYGSEGPEKNRVLMLRLEQIEA